MTGNQDVACSCEEVRAIIREELAKAPKAGPRGRVKRRPSGYNLFMGECRKSGKEMKACAVEYKALPKEEKERLKNEASGGEAEKESGLEGMLGEIL